MSRFTFIGRAVQGDVMKPQPQRKDDRTGALKFRKNGDPDCPFYIALAIPKNPAARFHIAGVPTYEDQRAVIDQDARSAWPDHFKGAAARPAGLVFDAALAPDCTNPKFANKIIDGDGFDDKGNPYSANEGWAGCWVIKFQNGYPPEVSEWVENFPMPRGDMKTGWLPIAQTGRTIKLGDYLSVSGTCESNQSTQSQGMYMNFDTVGFEKEGDLIVARSAVDTGTALGSRGAPNGGSASAASTGGPAPTPPSSATAPAYSGYRETQTAAPPPPAPPAGPVMTAAATNTFDEYIAAGWNEAQLRERGLIV